MISRHQRQMLQKKRRMRQQPQELGGILAILLCLPLRLLPMVTAMSGNSYHQLRPFPFVSASARLLLLLTERRCQRTNPLPYCKRAREVEFLVNSNDADELLSRVQDILAGEGLLPASKALLGRPVVLEDCLFLRLFR